MRIAYVDGFRLYAAFWAGAAEVQRIRSHLDAINVFPVPDGDTGSNLTYTLQATLEQVRPERHLGKTFLALADASLLGARGNSGLILAQYFLGVAGKLERFGRVQAKPFCEALVSGVSFAASAVAEPREGTILTVMGAWADSMKDLAGRVKDIGELFPAALPAAKAALLDTPNRLSILASAGVLDAGGKGFLAFLEGIGSFIKEGNLREVKRNSNPVTETEPHPELLRGSPEFRYCTEALLIGEKAEPEAVRDCLRSHGNSVIVGGCPARLRIHVHTNEPARLFAELGRFGTSRLHKAEDMVMQAEVYRSRKSPVALVTDSSCDLPQEFLDAHQVHVVPLRLSLGGSEYLDKRTLTPDEFYSRMGQGSRPSTSQPSVKDFQGLYDFLSRHYESILSIHLSSALSGTFNAARAAAGTFRGKRIEVVDSRHLCASLGLIVLRAAESLEAGLSLDETLGLVEEWSSKARILVCLQTIRFMVQGGRIGPVKGALAGLLNLKPVISVDSRGRGTAVGKARNFRANLDRIRFFAEGIQSSQGIWRYAIAHAHAFDAARSWAGEMEKALGLGPSFIVDISPVIGLNSGPGSLALALLPE